MLTKSKKRSCYPSIKTLAFKNFSDRLFVVCFSLNMLFLPFSRILTCKSINNSYPVPVYTLNIQQPHLISLLITFKSETFAVQVSFGVENINRTFLLTLKTPNILRSTLSVVGLLLSTLSLLFFPFILVILLAARIR